MKNSIHLIKFDVLKGVNEYCNYQFLADADIILVKSGRIGSEFIHDAYDGGERRYAQLISKRKASGYKEIEFEEVMNGLAIVTYHYSTDKNSGLLIFDCEKVEKFVKDVMEKTEHSILLSIFSEKIPITSCYQTPLGLIPKKVIHKAQSILGEIEDLLVKNYDVNQANLNLKENLMSNSSYPDINNDILAENQQNTDDPEHIAKRLFGLINEYFSLIPTDAQPNEILKIVLEAKLFVFKQQEICSLMLKYYSEIELIKSTRMPKISDNDIKIERVTDREVFNKISSLYAVNNGSVLNPKITNIYKISFGKRDKKFVKISRIIGNIQSVWHGTKKKNIASILTKGLLHPENLLDDSSNGLYGSGIYFSSSSSNSLTYCDNSLNCENNTKNTSYLILASVAAGNYFEPNRHEDFSLDEFDSTWLYRETESTDELIVYLEGQVKIDYILEIEKD
jgi:hypothetical protein